MDGPFFDTQHYFGVMWIGAILLGLAWIVISIILCVWVYRDARQRYPPENPEPLLWLIIVLFIGIVGLIIYLLVRPEIGTEYWGNLQKNRIG